MSEHQQNLVANVPAFVEGLEATLEQVDSIQVGVVATDPYSYNCENFVPVGWFGAARKPHTCDLRTDHTKPSYQKCISDTSSVSAHQWCTFGFMNCTHVP